MAISKRVLLDSIEAQQYEDQQIHYWFDDSNITEGQLLVWGPVDTLYEDMPMVYSVKFSSGYPFDPPNVLFLTGDGYTRFHPNMYKEGKVCLSILGTWEGPKWVASQRMSSVGLTLQSLMDNNPIVHEPGYANKTDSTATSYNEFIGFRCISFLVSLLHKYANGTISPILENFKDIFIERVPKLIERLERRLMNLEEKEWLSVPYSMTGQTNYNELRIILALTKEKLVKQS